MFSLKKASVFLAALIVVLLISIIGVLFLQNRGSSTSKVTQKQSQPKAPEEDTEHGYIHVVHFSYDPKTKKTLLTKKEKVRDDLPALLTKKPVINDDSFGYKVEILSQDGNLIQSGWNALYQELILQKDGTYEITVPTRYVRASIVKIYSLDSKLLLSTKML